MSFKKLDMLNVPLKGINLIEASAGTGKTFTIAKLYLRLLLEIPLPVQSILVVTFTDAATKELKTRIREDLCNAYTYIQNQQKEYTETILYEIIERQTDLTTCARTLKRAINDFDEAAIFTIHGFCRRMLKEHAFETGLLFDEELITDQRYIIQEIIEDFIRKHLCIMGVESLEVFQKEFSVANLLNLANEIIQKPLMKILPDRNAGNADPIFTLKHDFLDFFKTELDRRKRLKNMLYFDDLLLRLKDVLHTREALIQTIQHAFQAALIDEFQDTDPVQYDIFTTIFSNPSSILFLIGDPKQSIYGFRGADIFSYLKAVTEIEENKYTLSENFRSETGLIHALNHLFNKNNMARPFVLENIPYHSVDASSLSKGNQNPLHIDEEENTDANVILWLTSHGNKEEAAEISINAVVFEISRLLQLASEGKARIDNRVLTPGDFAVLVLNHKSARGMQKALCKANIPSVIQKSGSVFESTEVDEVKRFLLAVNTPNRLQFLNAALTTDMIGIEGNTLFELMTDEKQMADYETHIQKFSEYNAIWETKGFIVMFRKFLSDYSVRQNLLSIPNGERRLTNVLHLSELIHTEATHHQWGIHKTIAWLFEQSETEKTDETYELRLERDDAAVQILTVFSSKGLEYPIVFCPFMWERQASIDSKRKENLIFHKNDNIYIDLGSPDKNYHTILACHEKLSELMRLLYVGLTRAKNRCYLTCGLIGDPEARSIYYLFLSHTLPEDDPVNALKKQIKHSQTTLPKAIQSIVQESGNTIALRPIPKEHFIFYPQDQFQECGLVRSFSGKIYSDWMITSFSKLISYKKETIIDEDIKVFKRDEPLEILPIDTELCEESRFQPKEILELPRGTLFGSCIHTIFEQIDFTANNSEIIQPVIQNALKKYGLNYPETKENERCEAILKMILEVLKTPLLEDDADFCLHRIPKTDYQSEMNFFYPIKPIQPRDLEHIFKIEHVTNGFPEKIGRLQFNQVQGFMQGFIDLVFYYKDKYYLLDWKTNFLGESYLSYAEPHLNQVMTDNMYHLQYAIYTLAVHRYLKNRVLSYDYRENFGGVFYLFVRGMSPTIPKNGIFYTLPSYEFIDTLDMLL
ncbi:MAG: UvrD-helicase domain-containing protein [Desulfobacterales bacterium]|nr:UvrD-helicase domain-containing protein [Desulfobacterales bacterium]